MLHIVKQLDASLYSSLVLNGSQEPKQSHIVTKPMRAPFHGHFQASGMLAVHAGTTCACVHSMWVRSLHSKQWVAY